ncbi:MAG: histidine phosphatase family protein [Actinomycetota bacterium]
MRLLLVRHGESICGVNGIVGGERGCTGLTERGFAQARALRDRLDREGLRADALLASTLPRAWQTAGTLAPVLGADVVRDADLCEFVPGDIDGTRWDDWAERFDVGAEPDRPLSTGGESLNCFRSRVTELLNRLAETYDGRTVVAASHGGVVWASRSVLLSTAEELPVDFTSITEWTHEHGRWTLVRINDTAHLEGTDLLAAPA